MCVPVVELAGVGFKCILGISAWSSANSDHWWLVFPTVNYSSSVASSLYLLPPASRLWCPVLFLHSGPKTLFLHFKTRGLNLGFLEAGPEEKIWTKNIYLKGEGDIVKKRQNETRKGRQPIEDALSSELPPWQLELEATGEHPSTAISTSVKVAVCWAGMGLKWTI